MGGAWATGGASTVAGTVVLVDRRDSTTALGGLGGGVSWAGGARLGWASAAVAVGSGSVSTMMGAEVDWFSLSGAGP